MPIITGTSGDDTLTGTDEADVITGGGGIDSFIGRGGDDIIDGRGLMSGGDGDDRFIVRGNSTITGGSGYDTVDLSQLASPLTNRILRNVSEFFADGETVIGRTTTSSSNTAFPIPTTTNTIFTANSIERLIAFGPVISDIGNQNSAGTISYNFTGRASSIEVVGNDLNETMRGGSGRDILRGGGGSDLIYIGTGDQAFGGDGEDSFVVTSIDADQAISIDGGAGRDTITVLLTSAFSGLDMTSRGSGLFQIIGVENVSLILQPGYTGPVTPILLVGDNSSNRLTFSRSVNASEVDISVTIFGGAGDDELFSDGQNDQLYGDDGNDVITGAGSLSGGSGNDRISGRGLLDGGSGDDTLTGTGRLRGGDGNDFLTVPVVVSTSSPLLPGNAFESSLTTECVGGAGVDTFQFGQNLTLGLAISLVTGTAVGISANGVTWEGSVSLREIENVIGGSNADIIEGDSANNELRGGGGDDVIRGRGGDDVIYGNGTGSSSPGANQLYGDDGNDTLFGDSNSDLLHGGLGNDLLFAGEGDDILIGDDGNDQMSGGEGNDRLEGGNGDDLLNGDAGNDRLEGGSGADRLDGGAGNDNLFGGVGNDVLTGGLGSDTFDGGDGADTVVFGYSADLATFTYENGSIVVTSQEGREVLTGIERLRFSNAELEVGANGQVVIAPLTDLIGTDRPDRLIGTAGRDNIVGQAGNDFMIGGRGSDLINGGAGIDTAAYSGNRLSYELSLSATAITVVGGAEGGLDFLTGVEILQFLDGRLSFDPTDITSVVFRLYDAAFDRAPDVYGLADYSQAIREGRATVQSILNIFEGSAEFQARYGGLNNDQFVREMYRFSLNREGDEAGVASYVTALNNGTATRAQVLGVFSESPEHQALISAFITRNGLFVQDEQTAAVARLYDSVFNRLPDLGGLQSYRSALDQGFTLADVATVLVNSSEFQTRFGSLTNQQFVEQIYRAVLNREGDAAGVQTYVQALNNGFSRTDVVLVLSESQEHRFGYQATYDTHIRQLGVNGYDPSGTGVGRAPIAEVIKDTDAFVLPALEDLAPAVVNGADHSQDAFPDLIVRPEVMTGNRMLTAPIDDNGVEDQAAWFRTHDSDGWMMN